MGEKFVITHDDLNTVAVDMEVGRLDAAKRMAEHQQEVLKKTPSSRRMMPGGSIWRKSMFYMPIFALIASLLAWTIGEVDLKLEFDDTKHFIKDQLEREMKFQTDNYSDYSYSYSYDYNLREERQKKFRSEQNERLERFKEQQETYQAIWMIILGAFLAIALSVAEPVVSMNHKRFASNAFVGLLLGALVGYLTSLFINDLYKELGGGQVGSDPLETQQIIARSVGWSIFGGLAALTPGILMRNWKKLILGLFGGLIGGFVGGAFFDVMGVWLEGTSLMEWISETAEVEPAIVSRMIAIVAIYVFTAIAMTFLEDIAKQGWLKVATGVITGKQFILYRNPTVIGSSPNCEIYLFKDATVAPRHVSINCYGGKYILAALNNANVLVNGVSIRQATLKTGDQIRVGNTVFLFEAKIQKGG